MNTLKAMRRKRACAVACAYGISNHSPQSRQRHGQRFPFERARVGTVVYTGTLHERMIHPARCGTERPHLRYLSVAPAPREPSEYFGYLCSRPGAAEPDGEPAGRRGLSARGRDREITD